MDFNLIKPNNLSFPRKCLINFLMGSLSVLSLEPINFFVVLFFTIPIYIFNFDALNDEKNFHSRKIFFIKCFLLGMSFGYGFYFFSLYWIIHFIISFFLPKKYNEDIYCCNCMDNFRIS